MEKKHIKILFEIRMNHKFPAALNQCFFHGYIFFKGIGNFEKLLIEPKNLLEKLIISLNLTSSFQTIFP